MMGYMKDFYEIVHLEEVGDTDDDQLYYTKLFLSTPTRVSLYLKKKRIKTYNILFIEIQLLKSSSFKFDQIFKFNRFFTRDIPFCR